MAIRVKCILTVRSLNRDVSSWAARGNAGRLPTDSLVTYGKAKTSTSLPDLGCRSPGANSDGISVDQLPPPVPAGMAMYCFPFARYVIGNPCAEVIRRVCQRIFPVAASYAYM